ncbi:hypothetical protein [Stutzerimonas stutzeri]|nr:hypothetical protein [Stutzerimonas stutzeri]MCQ4320241.1 hypothetical protein [Stutzerimonas stutzeri]
MLDTLVFTASAAQASPTAKKPNSEDRAIAGMRHLLAFGEKEVNIGSP